MSNEKNTGGTAFPTPSEFPRNPGMTLRDYFAAKAQQKHIAWPTPCSRPESNRPMRSISKSRIARMFKDRGFNADEARAYMETRGIAPQVVGAIISNMRRQKTMSENQLQQAVARLLDHSGLVWCHPPNGGNRTARTGALMKSMGAKAGVPDVMIFCPFGTSLLQTWAGLAIELKVGKNKPTPAQLKWHEDLRRCGWRVDVCRTVDEVLAVLRECYPNKFKP